jgi:diketogulonate reductase-like aldo/keto reductase
VPYSPLGRGFLAGRFTSPDELDEGDFRRGGPRFTGENLEANLKIAAKVKEIATEKGITPGQLAIAWVLARGDDLIPIPGTKRRLYLEENAGAVDVELRRTNWRASMPSFPSPPRALRRGRDGGCEPLGRSATQRRPFAPREASAAGLADAQSSIARRVRAGRSVGPSACA